MNRTRLLMIGFVALALGFAAPFTLLSMTPALIHRLPRPGGWMDVFRRALAFPMYATALWLLWVLSVESNANSAMIALAAALVLAFALWIVGANQQSSRVRSRALPSLVHTEIEAAS